MPPRKPRGEVPWAFVAVAGYTVGGLVSSSYYLLTLDKEVAASCYKCATDAWGQERQYEGLDELATWIEWSLTAAVDVTAKLVGKHGVHRCVALGLESPSDEVRGLAFEALASLTRQDHAAKTIAAATEARALLERKLDALVNEPTKKPTDSAEWERYYGRRLGVLVGLANLTRDPRVWGEHPLDTVVPNLVRLLTELREAVVEAPPPTTSRLGAWVAELQESVVRDMIAELLAHALSVAHHASRMRPDLFASRETLELLADLAWSDDADCALHANYALHNALAVNRLPIRNVPEPELGQPSGLDPRTALALNRALDALAPLPLALAMAWGAARRVYKWHATGETFTKPRAKLPTAALGAALATAAASALLTALYGPRGARYEFRRQLHWSEDDVSQIALATAVTAADLAVFYTTLYHAPFVVTPFVALFIFM